MHSYYSNHGTILRGFKKSLLPLRISHFQKGAFFVGYKAGTRINELVHEGLVERMPIDIIGEKGQRFAQYQLTEKGIKYEIPPPTFKERINHYLSYLGRSRN